MSKHLDTLQSIADGPLHPDFAEFHRPRAACRWAIAESARLSNINTRLNYELDAEASEHSRSQAKIERLQAIIDKLPKCWRLQDGKLVQDVPVVPGTDFWKVLGPTGSTWIRKVRVSLTCSTVDASGWNRTCSTREAAEAKEEE